MRGPIAIHILVAQLILTTSIFMLLERSAHAQADPPGHELTVEGEFKAPEVSQ